MKTLTIIIVLLLSTSAFATNWNPPAPEPESVMTQEIDVDNTNVNANANKNTAVGIGGKAMGIGTGGNAYQKNDVNTSDMNFNKVNTDVNTTDLNFVEGSKSSSNSGVGFSGNSSNKNYVGDSESFSAVDKSGNSANFVHGSDVTIAGDTLEGSTQTQQSASDSSADNSGNNTGNADVNVDASDHSITQYEAAEIPVSTTATTFSSICTMGAANQKNTYGISIATNSMTCEKLMLADAYMALGMIDEAKEEIAAARKHSRVKGFGRYILSVATLGMF